MSNLLQAAELVAAPTPEYPYRIPGLLPKGAIMLLGGETGIGKSFLSMDLAAAVASGGKFWGWLPVERCPVLYVEAELGTFGLQKRLKRRYKDRTNEVPPGFWIASRDPDVKLDTPAGITWIRDKLDETQAEIVIFDPVARLMIGLDFDGAQVGRALANIDRLLGERPSLSVVLVHHFVKPREALGDDSLYRFRGGRWMDNADVVCVVRRLEEQEGDMFRWKMNWEKTRHDERPGQVWFRAGGSGVVEPAEPPPEKKKAPTSMGVKLA